MRIVAAELISIAAIAAERGAVLDREWHAIGPFASGKSEFEGDPLAAARGGVHRLYHAALLSKKRKRPVHPISDLVVGGHVDWQATRAGQGGVILPHQHVDWQTLQRSPPVGSASDALHTQYWVAGRVHVRRAGIYSLDCSHLHTFELVRFAANGSALVQERIGPLMGNIYGVGGGMGRAAAELAAGTYHLFSRVRGKPPLRFKCELREGPGLVAVPVAADGQLPDVVRGEFLTPSAAVAVDVRNVHPSRWLRLEAAVADGAPSPTGSEALVVSAAPRAATDAASTTGTAVVAPGAAARILLRIQVRGPPLERDAARCARFTVRLAEADGEAVSVAFSLRCRQSAQSALMTFVDADGSLGSAAVLRPRSLLAPSATAADRAYPMLVSLSGVGVSPQSQADAYKWKPQPGDEHYTFGYDGLWIVAPERPGPHNWEDVGMRTVLSAIDALGVAFGPLP